MRLNLGAADRRVEGFISVDIAPPADVVADLSERWPWEDSSVDEVLAYDVCEHILSHDELQDDWESQRESGKIWKQTDGRIWFLNELWRVLKPGGRAIVETPNAAKGSGYFQDPTHCSPY